MQPLWLTGHYQSACGPDVTYMVYWALSVTGCGSDVTFMVDCALSVFACGPDVTCRGDWVLSVSACGPDAIFVVDWALSVSTVSADLPACLHHPPVCFSLCEVMLHRFLIIRDQLIAF